MDGVGGWWGRWGGIEGLDEWLNVFLAAAQSLATTLLDKELADIALTVLYGCFTVMSIFAPRVVSLLGPKCVRSCAG
jgi:hypothetical protein